MKILLISEHYHSKIGGTVSYVKKVSNGLRELGHDVFLLVPSIGNEGKIIEESKMDGINILNFPVSKNSANLYSRSSRKLFCNFLNTDIVNWIKGKEFSIVHVLSGLFAADSLNVSGLKSFGIRTLHTIHNVPPEECSNSFKGDNVVSYFKDNVRKLGVKWINKKRIKKQDFDAFVVPSSSVKILLSRIIDSSKISIIPHGVNKKLINDSKETVKKNTIFILTVGGFIPHKQQDRIVEVASFLRSNNIDFRWNLVGPVRNKRYYQFVKDQIISNDLKDNIFIHTDLDDEGLKRMYLKADLYVQLSTEEGFCLSVMDAISMKVPVLATPVGAIPEMLNEVEGVVLDLDKRHQPKLIEHNIRILNSLSYTDTNHLNFIEKYSWENSFSKLLKVYHGNG